MSELAIIIGLIFITTVFLTLSSKISSFGSGIIRTKVGPTMQVAFFGIGLIFLMVTAGVILEFANIFSYTNVISLLNPVITIVSWMVGITIILYIIWWIVDVFLSVPKEVKKVEGVS